MARLRPLSKEEAPPEARPMLEEAERAFGVPLIPSGIQARCPPILEAGRGLGAALVRSHQLTREMRHMVCVRVAQIVGCPF